MHAPHICIFAPTTAEWEDNEEYVDNAAQEQREKKSIKCVTNSEMSNKRRAWFVSTC